MKTDPKQSASPRLSRQAAFSMLELVGVLFILALLAAALAPALVRQLDRVVGDQEGTRLKALGDALRAGILRARAIPAHTNWASVVAAELGADSSGVLTNGRGRARVFLIDPAFEVGVNGAGLPYTQTVAGSRVTNGLGQVIPPVSPRLLLVSSIGPALPAGLPSGVPSATNFNAVWDAVDGLLPAGPAWAGWTGRGDDVRIQRVHLGSSFVRMVLNNYFSNPGGRYAVDALATNAVPTNGVSIDAYFLQGSVVRLLSSTNTLPDSQQILSRDVSYACELGIWRGNIFQGPAVSGMDLTTAAASFMAAPTNGNASGGSTQQSALAAMQNFMNAYNTWASAGFPSGGLKNAALTAQSAMMTQVDNLLNNPLEVVCP